MLVSLPSRLACWGWALEWGSPSLGPSAHLTVADMGKLAQEVLGCGAELLRGGLGPPNRDRILKHLLAGHPLLIPYPGLGVGGQGGAWKRGVPVLLLIFALDPCTSYDEDFNHEPCQRRGHKAHWAVSAGGYNPPGLLLPLTSSPLRPPPALRGHRHSAMPGPPHPSLEVRDTEAPRAAHLAVPLA